MKKSIFLFFAAILCAIGMNAETYRYSGEKDSWAGTQMTVSADGYYSYYGPVTGTHKFKIGTSSNQWAYNHSYVTKGFNNTDIQDIGDWDKDNCYTWTSATHYILVYYPNTTINTTNKVKICASTFLPDDRECYLMGVGGDWTTGIKMELNSKNKNEFICLDQPIKDPIKFKVKGNTETWTDQVENYDKNGVDWKEGNIVLPAGNYDFYFKKDIMKVYIARNTVVTTTANPAEGGTLTGAGVYNNDDDVTLTATPNTGYNFVNWTKGGEQVSADATYAFKAAGDVEYVANFVKVVDVTLSDMVTTPYSHMGSYRFLSLDDEDGNQISIFNGTEGAYGNDFEVNAYLAAYDVTVVGTGDWNVVDGVETLTATLQVEDDNTTIYNVVATVGAATTITLECLDATYKITDLELNEVTFTGIADGKEFTIVVAPDGTGYYSDGEWDGVVILATSVTFDDSDPTSYVLGGTYIDDASNTYNVQIVASPAPTELFCEDATVTLESGSLMIQAMWGERQVLVSLQQTTTQGTGTYEAADVYGMLMNPWAELSAVNDECTYQEMGETFQFSGLLTDGTVTYDVWIKGSTASATPATGELEAKDEVYFACDADGAWTIEAFADDMTWGMQLALEFDPMIGEYTAYGYYISDVAAGTTEEVLGSGQLYYDDFTGRQVFKATVLTTAGGQEIYPVLYASELSLMTNDLMTAASWHGEIAGVDYYEVLMAAADYSWELDLHARECTGAAGTYTVDVVDEAEGAYSTFMGGYVVTGELTITEDNGDLTYEGEVYTQDAEGNQAMTITFMAWQLPAAAYVINIDDATVIEDLGQYGSSWSMKGEVELEGTTYPVTVEIADEVDLTVPSADVYLSVTVEEFGFVDGNATLTINGNTMAVEGELENAYAGVKFVFNISGTLPTCANIRLQTGNNAGVLAAADGKQVNVTVARNFTANEGYYTLCVPFDMPASVIGKAYQISEILGNSATELVVYFTEVTTILAGQPYLIEPAANLDGFTVEGVTIDNSTPAAVTVSGAGVTITMQGKYNRDAKTNGLYWIGNGGYLYNDDVWPNALCAYFDISTPSGIAPRMRVATKENTTTGFDNITNGENITIKVIENGQLIIIRNGEKFNAQGVRF